MKNLNSRLQLRMFVWMAILSFNRAMYFIGRQKEPDQWKNFGQFAPAIVRVAWSIRSKGSFPPGRAKTVQTDEIRHS